MSMRCVIGIDPGNLGSIAIKPVDAVPCVFPMPPTYGGIRDLITDCLRPFNPQMGPPLSDLVVVYIEKLTGAHAPRLDEVQTNSGPSMMALGKNIGIITGCFMMSYVPVIEVTPQAWQKELRAGSKGDLTTQKWKNKLLALAQSLHSYPDFRLTQQMADSVLIMEYGIRAERGLLGQDEDKPAFEGEPQKPAKQPPKKWGV